MYIFKQAKNAILYFDKYSELLKTKISKVIIYALFFIILSSFIYSSYPFISYYTQTKGFDNFIEKYIPNFTVENNKIIFDKYVKTDTTLGLTFIFDTKENNTITQEDKKDVKTPILKFTPTHIISSELNFNIELQPFIKGFNIQNKSDLVNIKLIINLSNFIAFIILMILFVLTDLFWLIISMLLINFISKMYGLKFIFSEVFKLTVYVSTIPYILKLIFFCFSIPMPSFIYIGIILAYLHFIFKTILINNKNIQKNTL